MSDLATSLGLTLAHTGTIPTFTKGAAKSIIDVTFYRGVELEGWQVIEADSLSDLAYVGFNAATLQQVHARPAQPPNTHEGWSVKQQNCITILMPTNSKLLQV